MVVRALPSPSRGARCACRGRVAMWLVPEQARARSAPGVTKGDRRSPWAPKDSTAAPTDAVRGRPPIRCHALADLSPTRGRCAADTSHRHPAGGGTAVARKTAVALGDQMFWSPPWMRRRNRRRQGLRAASISQCPKPPLRLTLVVRWLETMSVSIDELQSGQESMRSGTNYMSDRRNFHYGGGRKSCTAEHHR